LALAHQQHHVADLSAKEISHIILFVICSRGSCVAAVYAALLQQTQLTALT
jgi:hypothetical protein